MSDSSRMSWQEAVMAWEPEGKQASGVTTARVLGVDGSSPALRVAGGWAIFAAALALGLAGDLLLRALPWGVNVTIWLLALCATTLMLPRIEAFSLPRARGGAWLWAAIGFSLMLMWRSSPVLQTLNLIAVFLCLGMVAFRTSGGGLRLASITEYAANIAIAVAHALLGGIALLGFHLDWRAISAGERSARLAALGRGLALAAIPAVVFGALFASADIFFRDVLRDLLVISLDDLFEHVLLWAVVAWVAGSYLWGALLIEREAAPEAPRVTWLRFEFIETAVVFGLINGLFLLFVGVQFRYLFGGANRVESSSTLTYAEYARRGFFELVAVAALVVPFLLITHWLLPRAQARLHRFYGAVAGLLIALVFVVMASALQRMRLYQENFGLTELRMYTTAFMFWLVAVFAWLAFTVLRGQRERFTFGVFAAGLVVVLGLNAINPDGFIVTRNAAIAGDDRPFDSQYALDLSADSVPALVANFDDVPAAERCHVASELDRRWGSDGDWRSWSWGRWRAHEAVAGSDALAAACQ